MTMRATGSGYYDQDGPTCKRDRYRIRLPSLHHFDGRIALAPYLEQLAEDWLDPRVDMRVEFEHPWQDPARSNVSDAVAEWAPQVDVVAWEQDTLHFKSVPIGTAASLVGFELPASRSSGLELSNRAVHDCVHRLAKRVLLRLDARIRITNIAIVIIGDVRHRPHH
jgi:hypothetical protein